jgi:signal peptidase I
MDSFQPSSEVPTTPILAVPAEEKTNWRQFFLDLIETLLLAVVLYFGINAISARVRVDGFSMVPTLQDGEYVLVSKLSYRLGEPQHGDIIVFKYPGEPPQDLIKRIIGLPGDTVQVNGSVVYVNGQSLTEPYIAASPLYQGQWQVPEGFLFVLGDNRNDSSDSHSWGLLPMENVIGKAVIIYWPPPMWKAISHYEIAVATPTISAP